MAVCLGLQDISGLKKVYGPEQAAELAGMCAFKLFLRLNDQESAEFSSKSLGDTQLTRKQHTDTDRGWSVSEHVVTEPIALPSEFMSIAQCTPENGMKGVATSPSFGSWVLTLLYSAWPKPVPQEFRGEHPDFVPRPPSDFILKPWSDDDLCRLRLRPSELAPDFKKKLNEIRKRIQSRQREDIRNTGGRHATDQD